MKLLSLSAAALALAAAPAAAGAPSLSGVFPPGGQAGSSVETTLSGADLAGARAVLVSGEGVRAELKPGGTAASCTVRLTLDPKAEAGPREIRLVTEHGASNGERVWVGRYPEMTEKEPNERGKPQELTTFPVTLNGRSDKAEDEDYFAFNAAAGETWVFSLNSARRRSELDGYMTLLDGAGRMIVFAMDTFGRDPRLVHTFKKAGRYVLQVRDTLYRGGPGFTYRLTIGKLPVVTRWSPLGGRPGSTVSLAVQGFNLGNTSTLQVKLPARAEENRFLFVPETALGPASPVDLFLDDLPGTPEQEPNDDLQHAAAAAPLPRLVDGRIDRNGDRDLVAFTAAEKQAVILDVDARRLGSRLDPVLRVLDESGKELAKNDDAVGRDSRLSFTAPKAGRYYAEVTSLSSRGGDDYFYRLRLGEPLAPSFRLSVTPDNPAVPSGAAAAVTVTARRSGGFNGDIELRVSGLPPGVTAGPAVVRAGQNSTVLTLGSAPGTAFAYAPLHITGVAKIGGKEVRKDAEGQETYSPPLAAKNQTVTRGTELLIAAVAPEPPYTLKVTLPAPEVKAGAKLELTVAITRKKEFQDDVAVSVLGLPGTIKPAALALKKGQAEGKLTLTLDPKTPPGPVAFVIQGNGKNIVVAAPAAQINVRPAS